jgi:hypothetical protein
MLPPFMPTHEERQLILVFLVPQAPFDCSLVGKVVIISPRGTSSKGLLVKTNARHALTLIAARFEWAELARELGIVGREDN